MSRIRLAQCAALAISLSALTGEARAQAVAGPPSDPPAYGPEPQAPATDAHGHEHAAEPGIAEAALRTVPERPRAGERTELIFTFADGAGQPVRQLMTHHARRLHVFIVSADMQVFGHLHSGDSHEPAEGSEAMVPFTFPGAGRYLVAADFMTEAGPGGARFLIDVAGSDEPKAAAEPAPPAIRLVELAQDEHDVDAIILQGTQAAGGHAVSLQKPEAIKAGEPVTLVYRFSAEGAPVTDLRRYLDAPLHLVVVKDDLSEFQHLHGTLPGEEHAGHGDHGSGQGGQDSHSDEGGSALGPEITARLSFPEPGSYYLFGQAAHGDRLLITRFPVAVR